MMRVRLISVAGLQLLGGLIDVLLVLGERQLIKLDMDAVAATTIYGLALSVIDSRYVIKSFFLIFFPRLFVLHLKPQ